jgi:uncharacterized protein with ATP-grasp and redox domains
MMDTIFPSQIDLDALPPPLLTSEPGSFAYRTFEVRIPAIIQEAVELNAFPDDIRRALEALRAEVQQGTIRGLREPAPDRWFWDQAARPYIGRTWLDVPWYWAEAFIYRRLIEATRYFQPGPWQGFDPYGAKKQTEWEPGAAPQAVNATLLALPDGRQARFETLLHASLWGNRTDLSYNVAAQLGDIVRHGDERANLLVDDAGRVWEFLRSRPRRRLIIIADNAGTELLMDLALVDFLLGEGLVERVALHVKQQPFFVSDTMPRDVEAGLVALPRGGQAARALGERIREHIEEDRLRLFTHWFYVTSLFYFQLPDDLRAELAAADLVIFKGDVNYRRLVGEVHWPPTTPFAQTTAYFPAPLVALRTCKGELIVGLAQGEAERLQAEDPAWMVNGRRGLVQARL